MKKTILALAACSITSGCSSGSVNGTAEGTAVSDSIGQTQEALDVNAAHGLVQKQGPGLQSTSKESDRIANTVLYYDNVAVNIGPATHTSNSISSDLNTLQSFIDRFLFDVNRSPGRPARSSFSPTLPPEQFTTYYNRGDLGIGRDMHCVENMDPVAAPHGGEIACYVRNFAAGDLGSEFQFGLSSSIAFLNALFNNPFATVGMVYRDNVTGPNKVFFVVYGADGKLATAAALDRVGVQHGGVAGVNYNDHIPSNCINCHGGNYDSGLESGSQTPTASGSLFLPFDADQFEGGDANVFKILNQAVWKVDTRSGNSIHPVANQLDAWYNNTSLQPDSRNEVFENNFIPTAVVGGWKASTDSQNFYNSVVRISCRNCHMANVAHPFDTETSFQSFIGLQSNGGPSPNSVVSQICSYQMPDSLQALRQFWQSPEPVLLESYLRANNFTPQANQLHACGPGNVATLDPPQLGAALSIMQ